MVLLVRRSRRSSTCSRRAATCGRDVPQASRSPRASGHFAPKTKGRERCGREVLQDLAAGEDQASHPVRVSGGEDLAHGPAVSPSLGTDSRSADAGGWQVGNTTRLTCGPRVLARVLAEFGLSIMCWTCSSLWRPAAW